MEKKYGLAQTTSYYSVKTISFPRYSFMFLFPLNNQIFNKIVAKVSFSQLYTFNLFSAENTEIKFLFVFVKEPYRLA